MSSGRIAQEFKVSPIWFISPNEKDKSGPVFMEKTTEDELVRNFV
jgi:hypothetical protein